MLQLQEELEGKGLSRAIVDGLLADRRAALTAEVEADLASRAGSRYRFTAIHKSDGSDRPQNRLESE